MNNLVQKVSEYMQEHHMVEDGQKIVVGVSGGADSMGLDVYKRQDFTRKNRAVYRIFTQADGCCMSEDNILHFCD